jgi:hypothetical protein
LTRLHRLIRRGLEGTAQLFAPVKELFDQVYRVAHELSNHDARSGAGVRSRWDERVREMDHLARRRPDLSEPLGHFVKVSRSYEPGLFHCYDVAHLPRTNNDLEQLFGSHRHHERRCSGRKVASPGLVVRGSVRLVAGLMTRLGLATGADLAPTDVLAWRELRAELGAREAARAQQRRFRRDPTAYLMQLEARAHQSGLPA